MKARIARGCRVTGAALALVSSAVNSGAAELPLWEAGIGATALYGPAYRGSDEWRGYGFPFPYLVYRGETIRADREGARARILETDRLRLTLSGSFSLPVRASSTDARQGMDDLPFVVEVGPALSWLLVASEDRRHDVRLRLPVRGAFTVEGPPRFIGWVAAPQVRWTWREVPWAFGSTLRLTTGPSFSTRQYHDFYYGVNPDEATPTRPAYEAGAGYSGWDLSVTAVHAWQRWRAFVYANADWIKGAAYEDSPLVLRSSGFAVGFGVAYVLGASSRRVRVTDD